MAGSLSLGLELIKFLHTQNNLSSDIKTLSNSFELLDIEIINALNEVALLDNSIVFDGNTVYLTHPFDFFHEDTLYKRSHGKGRVLLVDNIDSTNSHLMTLKDNVVNGDCLIAEIQTKGRGRNDHIWFSAIASSLTLSIAFSFKKIKDTMGLSIVSAVAICRLLQDFGIKAQVKWPNDIYCDEKKISGVLIESIPRKKDILFIVGIGLNIYKGSYQDNVNATALEDLLKKDEKGLISNKDNSIYLNRSNIAAALISKIRRYVSRFESEGMNFFLKEWQKCDYLFGKYIVLLDGALTYKGIVQGISSKGYLQIIDNQGHRLDIKAGHILLIKDIEEQLKPDFESL